MANYIIPAVMSRGILSQKNGATPTSATRIWDAESAPSFYTKGFIYVADAGNAADVFVGASNVATSGAEEGLALAAGEYIAGSIDGPGATQVFSISTVGTDAVKIVEVG